jgi:acetylornithine/succinyldiaminopimelate/putrescine aminotransferase
MVYVELCDERLDATMFMAEASKRGLRFLATAPRRFRFVTHYGIESADIDNAVEILKMAAQSAS